MQASRLTAIAGWLTSGVGVSRSGKRDSRMSIRSAHCQRRESGWCATSRSGWSASSSSITILRAVFARSEAVVTFMPGLGLRIQLATRTRSPSTSTMQARQLPSAR
jgi:hypothetical protein